MHVCVCEGSTTAPQACMSARTSARICSQIKVASWDKEGTQPGVKAPGAATLAFRVTIEVAGGREEAAVVLDRVTDESFPDELASYVEVFDEFEVASPTVIKS